MERNQQALPVRSLGIDAARTIMNLLIVLHHAWVGTWMIVERGPGETLATSFVSRITWTLPALFCLSGYLMMRGYSPETIKHKYWSRFKRLAVPLIVVNWAIIPLVFAGLWLGYVQNPKYDFVWAIRTFFLIKAGTTLSAMWYVRTLLVFTVFSPVIYFVLKTRKGRLSALVAAGAWCLCSTWLGLDDVLWKIVPSFSILTFLIGAVIAFEGADLCEVARKRAVPVCMAYVIGVIVGALQFTWLPYQNGLACALPCFFWFVWADGFARLMRFKWFAYLCECSFFIYIFHTEMIGFGPSQALSFVYKVVPRAALCWPGEYLCAKLFVAVIDVCICCLLYAMLKKTFPLLARVLNGRL